MNSSDNSRFWLDTAATPTPKGAPRVVTRRYDPVGEDPSSQGEGTTRRKLLFVLQLLGVSLASIWLFAYMMMRGYYMNLNGWMAPLAILLFVAELHNISHLAGMFYSLWPRKYETWPHRNMSQDLQCNLFVCVCGEPPAVVKETILAAREAARVYNDAVNPHHPARVVVLNDGKVAAKDNWRDIETICRELNVKHIARTVPGGFKAGNINNGLAETPTSDPHNTLDIVFDSDFCALPEFLLEITKPFVDDTVDWVQSPQRYQNEKTWVAKAAAAHQIFFFDYVCPAKGYDNALFLCGTNFAIRRSALEAVGGMETRWIIEDYATSLNLHLIGRRGVFMPKVLALGMAPSSLKQYFTQQRRWSKGSFDTTRAYLKAILFGPMTPKQKFHYMLSATYYLIGLRDLIMMLAPIPFLYFGVSLIRSTSPWFFFGIYLPMVVPNFYLYTKMFRYPFKSLVLDIVSFPVFTSAFFQSLLGQKLGFVVTIKKYERENPFAVYKSQIAVALTLIIGLIYSITQRPFTGLGMGINYWWAFFNAFFLSIGFYLIARENFSWKTWQAADADEAPSLPTAIRQVLTHSAPVPQAPTVTTTTFAAPEVASPRTRTSIPPAMEIRPASLPMSAPQPVATQEAETIEPQGESDMVLQMAGHDSQPRPGDQGFAEWFNRNKANREALFGEYTPNHD